MTTLPSIPRTLSSQVAPWVIAVLLCLVAAPAGAQTQADASPSAKPMSERFYTFDPQAIGGDVQKGVIVICGGTKRPVFERLLRLKRSFAKDIIASSTDPVLR